MEATNEISSCTANLILLNTDLSKTSNEMDGIIDQNSIVIKMIMDNIDEHIRVVKLETPPSIKTELIGEICLPFILRMNFLISSVPTYVKTLLEILADYTLDDEAFEAIITQHKIKYLKYDLLEYSIEIPSDILVKRNCISNLVVVKSLPLCRSVNVNNWIFSMSIIPMI